jgi:hypothetical protein
VKEPKYRRALNANQKDILLILYKFRYATVNLIAEYLELVSTKYTYVRLRALVDQKYISSRFTPADKINRKSAVFYLLPKGMRVIKTMSDLNQKAIPNIYSDRNRSQAFRDRSLVTFKLHNKFRELYQDSLQFYSKSELSQYGYFPKNLPDGFLLLENRAYMLEWMPASTIYPAIRSRVGYLIDHYMSDEWGEAWEDYPTILFVCETPYLERQVLRLAARLLRKEQNEEDFDDNLFFRTTTMKALLNAKTGDEVWTKVLQPEAPVSL